MLKPLGEILQGNRKFIHFQSITSMVIFAFCCCCCCYLLITSVKGNFTMEKYGRHLHQMIRLTVFVSYWCCKKFTTNLVAYNSTNLLSYGSVVQNSDMGQNLGVGRAAFFLEALRENIFLAFFSF